MPAGGGDEEGMRAGGSIAASGGRRREMRGREETTGGRREETVGRGHPRGRAELREQGWQLDQLLEEFWQCQRREEKQKEVDTEDWGPCLGCQLRKMECIRE